MRPPYPCDYWDELTPVQKMNDLVHKIAQLEGVSYPIAYIRASRIFDAPGSGTYTERVAAAGKIEEAIEALVRYHESRKAAP